MFRTFCPRDSILPGLGREICCLQAISLPSHQHTSRLRQRNLLSVGNFSAHAPAYLPAWTEKYAVCRQFLCPRTSISPGLGREICCLQAISLPSRQHTARLRLRNMLSVENFSALAPAYPRLRQRNLLSAGNFSALAPAYLPA